jgi:hypothetical protein
MEKKVKSKESKRRRYPSGSNEQPATNKKRRTDEIGDGIYSDICYLLYIY